MPEIKMGEMDPIGSICNPRDLRFKVFHPETTVDKIRDLQYYGSNNLNTWKSAYKKDYQYPHLAYLECLDKAGLRRPGEVILKDKQLPPAVTETQKCFTEQRTENANRLKNDSRYTKGRESNDRLLGGDDRLTNFTFTTTKTEYHPLEIESRTNTEKLTRLQQVRHVPIGNIRLTNEYIKAKNITDYPRHRDAEVSKPRFSKEHLCETAVLFRDANLNKMNEITTVDATYRVYGQEEVKSSRAELVPQYHTVSSVLFPVTNEPFGISESRRTYKPFSKEQKRDVPIRPTNWDCDNIFCKDSRILAPQTTLKSVHTAPPVRYDASLRLLDANGKREYKYSYGDVVKKELETDEKFIPKHLHQQSLTQDNYRHWGNDAYKVSTEHRTTVSGHLPACMEDGPKNEMITTHTHTYLAHPLAPYLKVTSKETGGINTAIPIGGTFFVKNTEFQDNYRKHNVKKSVREIKDLHSTTFKDAIGKADYRTVHKMTYTVPIDPKKALPAERVTERNTILNDGAAWNNSSSYLPPTNGSKIF